MISPAIDEVRDQHKRAAEASSTAVAAMQRMASLGENDLPASPVVASEMASIAAEARKLEAEQQAAAQRWQALRDRAEALPTMYRREHDSDERRLDGERGGRQREKRADVTAAEQDT